METIIIISLCTVTTTFVVVAIFLIRALIKITKLASDIDDNVANTKKIFEVIGDVSNTVHDIAAAPWFQVIKIIGSILNSKVQGYKKKK